MTEIKNPITAIIAAAGASRRMDGLDKLFSELGGKPLLARTVGVFETCPRVTDIIIVVSRENLERVRELAREQGWGKVRKICPGGERRQDSVAAGLKHASDNGWVIIHDGARPLVTGEMIDAGLAASDETGAAAAAVPVTDTIKLAGDDRIVQGTPPRGRLWAVQTPQVFRVDIIKKAYSSDLTGVTDDATLAERTGHRVKLFDGSGDNIKVTTRCDLALAEILIKEL